MGYLPLAHFWCVDWISYVHFTPKLLPIHSQTYRATSRMLTAVSSRHFRDRECTGGAFSTDHSGHTSLLTNQNDYFNDARSSVVCLFLGENLENL